MWIAWTNRAVRDAQGNLQEILCVGNDITGLRNAQLELDRQREDLENTVRQRTAELERANRELKRQITQRELAEAHSRESYANFQALFNNVPVGLYRNTPGEKGQFLMANPALLEMFEYDTEEEFLSISVSDIYVNPAQRKEFSEKLSRLGRLVEEPLKFISKNGNVFWGRGHRQRGQGRTRGNQVFRRHHRECDREGHGRRRPCAAARSAWTPSSITLLPSFISRTPNSGTSSPTSGSGTLFPMCSTASAFPRIKICFPAMSRMNCELMMSRCSGRKSLWSSRMWR